MKAELQDFGWSLGAHQLPTESMDLLVRKKNEFLETAIHEVQSAFNIRFEKFDADKAAYIELAKGITRSLLRYDCASLVLAKAILKELEKTYGLTYELNYFTLPNPIIHFPFDTSEIGPRHKDGYDYIEHFYTTWTPLNDCFHKPLSITENTHSKNGFVLRQLRSRIKLIDNAIIASKKIIYPDIPLGKFALWHGRTEHEGLLNTTKEITVSLVIRFTSTPALYDVAVSCIDLKAAALNDIGIEPRYFTKKAIRLFKEVDEFAKVVESEHPSFQKLFESIQEKIKEWDLPADECKRLGFVFGTWAQRMEQKRNVLVFYLFAFTGAHDNFYVLQKCITHIFSLYGKTDAQKFMRMMVTKYPGRQMTHVVKSAIAMAGEKAAGIKIDFPRNEALLTYELE